MKGIKTFCIVLALAVICCTHLPAQGGIKGGLNISKFISAEPTNVDQKFLTGFQVGLFYGLQITPNFQIQPEVLFARKGSKMRMWVNSIEIIDSVKISYIEIPVLLKLNIKPGGAVHPYLIAGPYAAFRIDAKETYNDGGTVTTDDIDDEIKSSDWGIIAGGGVEFKLGDMPKYFLLEVRYEIGLTDIVKSDAWKAKNSCIMFSAGIVL